MAIEVTLVDDRYLRGDQCIIVPEGGEVPPEEDSLDFSYSSNSQYLPSM